MNEGDSAGGGQQGLSPAPPAVPDRRSTTTTIVTTLLSSLTSQTSPLSTVTLSSSPIGGSIPIYSQQTHQLHQQQLQKRTNQQQQQQQQLIISGSAVSGIINRTSHQHHMTTSRFNTNTNISTNQQQQRSVIAQIQQQQQQSNNHNLNNSNNNIVSSSYLSGNNNNNNNLIQNSSSNTNVRTFLTTNNSGISSSDNSGIINNLTSGTITSVGQISTTINSQLIIDNQHNISEDTSNRKRLKVDIQLASGVNSIINNPLSQNTIITTASSSASGTIDITALKKRILEYKFSRLKSIKEKYSEHVAELFFLQSGGNMMEYPVWRKKPPTPQFLNFSKAYRLDGYVSSNSSEDLNKTTTQPSHTTSTLGVTNLPQGAEIKIPGVGATPIALSTQLPAAVVQLTQQGHIPGRPQGGRHGMVFGQIPVPPAVGNTSVPLVPGGTPLVPDIPTGLQEKQRKTVSNVIGGNGSNNNINSSSSSNILPCNILQSSSVPPGAVTLPPYAQTSATNSCTNSTRSGDGNGSNVGSISGNGNNGSSGHTTNGSVQEFTVKAKQEVYVMQRISELQREGLWTEKRLPKLQEPGRPKAHWDYLLEEMVWLAADFAQERKWKKSAAKKCARMVQKYFQDKANAAQKAEKAQELHLKRVAAFIAKEVKMFWSNVEKLVEYKHHTKLEEKRKKALDQHLSFIVDQTEKFSQQLTEGMNKTVNADNSTAPSLNSSRISSPKRENLSDDEFRPDSASEDDEETIAKAEAEAVDVNEEIAALQKESEMDLDDFLKGLPKDYLENRDKIVIDEDDNNNDDENDDNDESETGNAEFGGSENASVDEEFQVNEDSSDDEHTIQEQEKNERNVDHKRELDELNADNDLSIDELMAKYSKRRKLDTSETKMDLDSDDEDDVPESFDSDDTTAEEESLDESAEDDEETELSSEDENENDDSNVGLESLLEDEKKESSDNKDDLINDAAALAESIQPKGNTLSSTNVVTPVPFLLKHSLREYQHIGLDWLVTMHDRKLNGILADEMGLGKTIQTIALLAHLACVKGNWGPHLIVVPSSVMLNWEMEFKKWCPSFKILTYYGTQKERKQKRIGWTKPNAFHVCITSYKLVIQDQQSFRRKKWKYLILDEAQNIKNFKSQRWQLLLNFSTEQRLLLTGTPLQNNLMELWSLMHFLMPHVFSSHREFKEWFSNPMTGMIEGNSEYNDSIIKRLHKVLRPFLLRRLKSEVEKQMPKKYEHVIMCRLSKRQRYLYDDFMSRAKTRETLSSGNLLSVINVLMQLRKVCNHPNLFEVRPTISPFQMNGIIFNMPSIACNLLDYDPFQHIDIKSLNLILIQLELFMTAYVSHKIRKIQVSKKLIEEIDTIPDIQLSPPKCPIGKYKFHIRIKDSRVQENISSHYNSLNSYIRNSTVKVGTSPAMKTEGNKLVPVHNKIQMATQQQQQQQSIKHSSIINQKQQNLQKTIRIPILSTTTSSIGQISTATTTIATTALQRAAAASGSGGQLVTIAANTLNNINNRRSVVENRILSSTGGHHQLAQIVQTSGGRHHIVLATTAATTSNVIGGGGGAIVTTQSGQRFTVVSKIGTLPTSTIATSTSKFLTRQQPNIITLTNPTTTTDTNLVQALAQQLKTTVAHSNLNKPQQQQPIKMEIDDDNENTNLKSYNNENYEKDPEFNLVEREQLRKECRMANLRMMARLNQRRCDATPIYGEDCRNSISNLAQPSKSVKYTTWHSRSYTNCLQANRYRKDNWTLTKLLKSYEERTGDMKSMFDNFVLFVPPVAAPQPYLNVQHLAPSKRNYNNKCELKLRNELSPKLTALHPIISAMSTQFPDPRLIQYDCGKLQLLNQLLRELKSNNHRVLIFTQMTKMLDILEAFLNYHGHIYLRLDGTTRIEQRQILMERFNGDKRIFVFILSTRSGGVGVNLTGADTVIFYDSDWNPTMDAQAQDRCHRIGQTRDVHIYRLVSEKTIEENILKKANQKRLLGDLAIEGGNFTTAYFKTSTIQDLFTVEQGEDATTRLAEVLERKNSKSQDQQQPSTSNSSATTAVNNNGEEKSALGVFENALAAAEDEQDVQAAKTAKAEVAADLAEFDETIPLEDTDKQIPEMSKADQEVENLVKQLSPIERYAMRFVEETGGSWTAAQLQAAEAEIEQQKREWEANRLAALAKEEEILKAENDNDEMLTYSREDAKNQIWISDNTLEKMPMWCPPTPPQNDNDIYIDYSLSFLYETDIMPESHLPPVFIKKEYKRSRNEAGLLEGRRPLKIRKEDNYYAPRSLFDRPSPAVAKIRRDLKLQRYRGNFKPNVQIPGLKQQIQIKPLVEPEGMAEWCIYEDISILHVLQNLQGLPLNLLLLSPGHTPNWDLVAEIVNLYSRTYRPPKQCRYRYESVVVPREEGKLLESPKKQKKLKAAMKSSIKTGVKSLRTSQLYTSDNNASFTKLMKLKFDNIKAAYLKKAPPPKQVFGISSQKNVQKHASVLQDFGISNYDLPLSPLDIALRKAEKLKEKQRGTISLPPPPPATTNQQLQQEIVQQIQVQQQQQHPIQQIQQQHQQTTTAIVVQQGPQVGNQPGLQQVTQIMQAGPIQARTPSQGGSIQVHQPQIVKAIVTPSSGLVSSAQVQQIAQSQLQQQGQLQQTGNIIAPSSVSVVLTTPVSTPLTVSQGAQIVSIQQQNNPSTSSIISQSHQNASLVQSIPSQSMPQVVSVSQLATVGTVLTTSSQLQSNAGNVATLNASQLRGQRIVTSGSLQEVVLQQRQNTQSPTIVSMSGLGGQGVTQGQFPATQLRLSMGGPQQVSGVVTKGISLQQAGKLTSQSTPIQLYRQQLKVVQTSPAQGRQATAAVVQTANGQTALVNAAGTIFQSGIVPTGQTVQVQGQKVAVATVSGTNLGTTSVATVQVAPGQSRTQFIKQLGVATSAGKQTITRQVTDSEMLLVKRQSIGQQKSQILPQTQIFAPASVQVQAGPSNQQQQQQQQQQQNQQQQQQQQIATLVKTSSGMALSQLKPGGQIKVTMANQNQVRQLQLQQQLAIAQHRKVGKMGQIGQVQQKTGVPTQLIVQNPKNLPGSVTLQQFQQVIRPTQTGTLAATGQIVLGKTSVGRVIPVSVASQANARQTIQVVSAASAQALASGNIRAHVTGAQNIAGTIKLTTGQTQAVQTQAIINALQSQQGRQNASPVRLQTTAGGSLVAVTVQQQQPSNLQTNAEVVAATIQQQQQQQQHQQQQQTAQQQVRTLVKKKIMSIRNNEKEQQQ